MGGFAFCCDAEPEYAPMSRNNVKTGRLGEDYAGQRRETFGILVDELRCAATIGFFAGCRDENDVGGEGSAGVNEAADSGDDSSESAFHIGRASAVDSSIGFEGRKRRVSPLDLTRRNHVEVAGEKETRRVFAGGNMGRHVGAVGVPCIDSGLYTGSGKFFGDDLRGGQFTFFGRTFGPYQFFQQIGKHGEIL